MTEDQLVDMLISALRGPRGKELAALVIARARVVEPLPPVDADIGPIVKAACDFTGIYRKTLLDTRVRARTVTRVRHMVAYLARQTLSASYSEIGRRMGQDHTTILSGVRRVTAAISVGDPDTILLRDAILTRLAGQAD